MNSVPEESVKHALEDAFFRDVDSMIVSRLRSEAASDDAKKTLEQTGLHDQTLIDELIALGVTAEGLVAMRLVPMVMVAWAERGVDASERQAVLAEAYRLGVADGSVVAVLLENWLNQKPPIAILDAWKRYMKSDIATMSGVAKEKLIQLMERQMRAVAHASGGHLGVGKISKKEQQLITMMTHILRE